MEVLTREASAVVVRFNATEMFVLAGALREANEALEDWEFHTRMGVEREVVESLLEDVFAVSKKMRPHE